MGGGDGDLLLLLQKAPEAPAGIVTDVTALGIYGRKKKIMEKS